MKILLNYLRKRKEKKVQAIFNQVIEAGVYPALPFMCMALCSAVLKGVISSKEADLARASIETYLRPYRYLAVMLYDNGLPNTIDHRLVIYKNWAFRPLNSEAECT